MTKRTETKTTPHTASKTEAKKHVKEADAEYVITAPIDVFWPHTAPGREHGTPDGVPVRFLNGEVRKRSEFPIDDAAMKSAIAEGLVALVDDTKTEED